MSFSYPSFLWALLTLAVPVIIHLFNFRKTTRIYFSNIRFLKQVKEETTQKRKLKQWLVLASRLLFLFFLVMAFAQPFLPAKEQLSEPHAITIYIDNSLSMSVPMGDNMRSLDEAQQMAQGIVDLFPAETRYLILTNDFAPFSNTYKTKAQATDLLAQLKFSASSRTANEIIHRTARNPSTLFWISDFQQSTFGEPLRIDSARHVQLVPVKSEQTTNVFVDTAFLQNPFAIGGDKNSVTVRLRNQAYKKVEDLSVKLSINHIQAAASTVSIEPQHFADLTFDLSPTMKIRNPATITFSDYPVSFDNEFFIVLSYSKKLNVLEIKPGSSPTYIEKVFGNQELFSFRSFSSSNLNYSLLAETDLVVLNGINRLAEPLTEALQLYKNNFGALLLIPGADPDLSSYQKICRFSLQRASKNELEELDKPNMQNPFYANVFEDKITSIAMPKATKTMEWGTDRSALLSFKNGQPFLSQLENVFLLSCPLEKNATDFFSHALFVPVMYRIAANSQKNDRPLYYPLTASTVTVPIDSLLGESPVKWIGSQEFIPSQRKANGQLIFDLPKNEVAAGFYSVVNQRDTLGMIALNPDKKESMLSTLNPDQVKEKLGGKNISVFKASSAKSFNREIKEQYLGTPLWKYAVIVSLLFLLAEVLLIRFLK